MRFYDRGGLKNRPTVSKFVKEVTLPLITFIIFSLDKNDYNLL